MKNGPLLDIALRAVVENLCNVERLLRDQDLVGVQQSIDDAIRDIYTIRKAVNPDQEWK